MVMGLVGTSGGNGQIAGRGRAVNQGQSCSCIGGQSKRLIAGDEDVRQVAKRITAEGHPIGGRIHQTFGSNVQHMGVGAQAGHNDALAAVSTPLSNVTLSELVAVLGSASFSVAVVMSSDTVTAAPSAELGDGGGYSGNLVAGDAFDHAHFIRGGATIQHQMFKAGEHFALSGGHCRNIIKH